MARSSAALAAHGVSFQFDDGGVLFEDLDFALGPRCYGLVGRNGIGKSVLAQILAGRKEPTSGWIERHATLGFLPQDAADAVQGNMADALGIADRLTALARVEAGIATEMDYERIGDDWTLREDLQTALQGLELTPDLMAPTSHLSGGERTRLALLRLELSHPDFLILDEPTNHLDRAGRRWLIERMSRWTRGALIVSHDRELLAQVDRILELTALGLTNYGGNYSLYRARKDAELAAAQQSLESAQATQARERRDAQARKERQARRDAYGRKQRGTGSQDKMVLDAAKGRAEASRSRLAGLAENRKHLAEDAVAAAQSRVERIDPLTVFTPRAETARGVLFACRALVMPYGGQSLRAGLWLQISAGERVALTGANGSGKTTLLRLIQGIIEPEDGDVYRSACRQILLDQHLSFLDQGRSALENLQQLLPDVTQTEARTRLAQLRMRREQALRPVGELSGGERLKVALAGVFGGASAPALLLLDEPDNHLDFESLSALEQALRNYDGTVVAVSHSDSFLDAIGIERRIDLNEATKGQ